MRLADLHPQFLSSGGEGITDSLTGAPVPVTEGVGVVFDCPCGNHDEEHRCYVPFGNPLGPGPATSQQGWHRTGETFETLTLSPSIFRRSAECRGATCPSGDMPHGWHGYIMNGEIITP